MSEQQKTLLDQLVEEIPSAEVRFFDKTDDVAERIRALIEERGMTQRDLAEAMGKKESYVSRVLGGAVNLTLKTVSEFEDALGADVLVVPTSEPQTAKTKRVSVGYVEPPVRNREESLQRLCFPEHVSSYRRTVEGNRYPRGDGKGAFFVTGGSDTTAKDVPVITYESEMA